MAKFKTVTNTQALADLVREGRKTQSLTQEDLAGLSNTGTRFIIDLEKAKPTCQIAKVLAVLRALGISLKVKDE